MLPISGRILCFVAICWIECAKRTSLGTEPVNPKKQHQTLRENGTPTTMATTTTTTTNGNARGMNAGIRIGTFDTLRTRIILQRGTTILSVGNFIGFRGVVASYINTTKGKKNNNNNQCEAMCQKLRESRLVVARTQTHMRQVTKHRTKPQQHNTFKLSTAVNSNTPKG